MIWYIIEKKKWGNQKLGDLGKLMLIGGLGGDLRREKHDFRVFRNWGKRGERK